MLWIKSLHIFFVISWFAGLFYLPRLFVYHSMAEEAVVQETLKVMQRRLLVMMNIGAAGSWIFGTWLIYLLPGWLTQDWMQLKLGLVLVLSYFHWWCARIVREFSRDEIAHGHRWYRWFNEVPTVIGLAIILLVVVKPG